jgi:sigma-E factor negative regulatory protein RseC
LIEEIAEVVKVKPDCIIVEVQRQSACGSCAVNKGCGTAVLQKVLGRKRSFLELAYDEKQCADNKITVGDSVLLGLPERALVKGSAAVYMIPVFLMILFALLGEVVAEQMAIASVDSVSVCFAVIGLLVALIWLKIFSRRVSTDAQYQPCVLRKVIPQASLLLR